MNILKKSSHTYIISYLVKEFLGGGMAYRPVCVIVIALLLAVE